MASQTCWDADWKTPMFFSGLDNVLKGNNSCLSTNSKTSMTRLHAVSGVLLYLSEKLYTVFVFPVLLPHLVQCQQDAGHFYHSIALLCKAL